MSGETQAILKQSTRKSREELNDIEKMRTRRINAQVLSLRTLLQTSQVPTKKDKFSILSTAYDYIIHLEQSIKKLEEEIGEAERSDILSEENPEENAGYGAVGRIDECKIDPGYNDSLLSDATIPMARTAINGVFTHCNAAMCELFGFSKAELTSMSLFNLMVPEEIKPLFVVLGNMVTYPYQQVRYLRKACRLRDRDELCFLIVWLCLQHSGEPHSLQVTFTPLGKTLRETAFNQEISQHQLRPGRETGIGVSSLNSPTPLSAQAEGGGASHFHVHPLVADWQATVTEGRSKLAGGIPQGSVPFPEELQGIIGNTSFPAPRFSLGTPTLRGGRPYLSRELRPALDVNGMHAPTG
mmetsp:Transcript_1970/g.2052  ORF Transcript_1970/g.2052 Transcript_1970/m.2052 type:complete len:355 (-) Transcript_1970:302-1366(-)|eukprot:CAMPEP_0182428894 /NCGR_PEP_ID=MMETSP1167-20130531/24424_1 /TAXON_ID=2988 /ORGANISM="Mallomonas Sp, Strain CCMP3275" /LENGTH=354 /DNA_ID=CAMNT_0024612095 /DNA_START=23 /DNA_END=1087 /DNA_ORIENTATION=+